ncbi:biopolymer transporter ExbD [Roseibacterium beibuensis]|uniref:Biopolymer transport protein ExbD n=1 Tax=[Roseibacterium] beibuensis TaxID=1193142 RepID=A0ABP9LDT7_9RHOB|nr:biopolymer transporter ExbD [Roseibacterium beibuensis]MCS6623063.1 biopolymer transporter ExbD [Roseibacterium beibuensis]
MSFTFDTPRARRRPSLTPMVDVVFLLLVFFMLASRFGQEAEIALSPPSGSAGSTTWDGPPRLIEIGPDTLRLNGNTTALTDLADGISALVSGPEDPIVLMPVEGSDLQRLLDVAAVLRAAGFESLILVDAP